MKFVMDSSGKKKKTQNQQSTKNYQSWDPFTQSKFVYEINKQAGTEITRKNSYETAYQVVLHDSVNGDRA